MNPSLADLLEVVAAVPAETVILLPNNKNIIPVAEQADAASPKRVIVVPTRSIAQGLAAIVANRPDAADADALAAAMAEAALAVRSGEITRAVRDSDTPIGRVRAGDWLGIADGQVGVASTEAAQTLTALLADLVAADAEIVTLLTGEDADAATLASAAAWMERHRPDAEFEVVEGGQPLYPYLVSVE